MEHLFIPPLMVKQTDFKNFNLEKVKRVYFQFFFDTKDGNERFCLIAYAVGEKRKRDDYYKPIKLDVDEKELQANPNDYFFPKSEKATELIIGQLELSNVQIEKLIKDGEFLRFKPKEQQINPFCIVYDVTNGVLTFTAETANPCPPAIPPKDDVGDS